MRYFILVATLFAASACATGPSLQQAVGVHNVFRQVVLDVDAAYAPIYADAQRAADAEFPDDQALYGKAMQPYDTALNALTGAKQAERGMHLSLEQWAVAADGGKVIGSTYACAADAVDKLSLALGSLHKNALLYAATAAVTMQLRSLADGAACPVQP